MTFNVHCIFYDFTIIPMNVQYVQRHNCNPISLLSYCVPLCSRRRFIYLQPKLIKRPMSIVRAWEKYTQACGFLLEFIWEIRAQLPLPLPPSPLSLPLPSSMRSRVCMCATACIRVRVYVCVCMRVHSNFVRCSGS